MSADINCGDIIPWKDVPKGYIGVRFARPKKGELVPSRLGGRPYAHAASGDWNTISLIIERPNPVPVGPFTDIHGEEYELISSDSVLGFAVPGLDNCDAYVPIYVSIVGVHNACLVTLPGLDMDVYGGRRWLLKKIKKQRYQTVKAHVSLPWAVIDHASKGYLEIARFAVQMDADAYADMLNQRDGRRPTVKG